MSVLAGLAGSAIVGTLVSIAAKVGAKQVEKYLGAGAGGVAGDIIGAIAEQIGLPVDQLDKASSKQLEAAVAAVEEMTPELVMAYTAGLAEQNRLALAELNAGEQQGKTWTWAWRPGGMWLFLAIIVWLAIVAPLVNLFLRLWGASVQLELVLDVSTFVTLFLAYMGLYMGGHTAKSMTADWRAAREAQAK